MESSIIRLLVAIAVAIVVFWLLSYVHVVLAAVVAVLLFLAIVFGAVGNRAP